MEKMDKVTRSDSLVTGTSRASRKDLGFGEGVCMCSGCMRKAPPIREDPSIHIAALTVLYAKQRDAGKPCNNNRSGQFQPTERDKELANLLWTAAEMGKAQQVEDLLCNGFACKVLRADAATELMLSAAQLGHAAVVNILADMGADLEITDDVRGGRPLMHAATNGHVAVAAALLKHGAEREARDWNGYTALMIAVFSDRSTAALALLEHGACVDAIDEKGRTGLCHAARYGATDCIHVLAEHGADVFAIDEDGLCPLDIAEQNGRVAAASTLRKMEQRQRMQDKRLMRQKLDMQGSGTSLNMVPAVSKEQADMNMQALLLELEEDEKNQKERKAAKHAKKKGKQHKKKVMQELGSKEKIPAQDGQGKSLAGSSKEISCSEDASSSVALIHAEKPVTRDHAMKFGQAAASRMDYGTSQYKSMQKQTHQQVSTKTSPAALEDRGALKLQWTAVLEEAVNCRDMERIMVLAAIIESLMAEVAKSGVSVKYGKKVLAKLQKAPQALEALQALMAKPDAAIRPAEFQEILEFACRVRHHLDPEIVENAEARLQRLIHEHEEAKWAKLKAELCVPRYSDSQHVHEDCGIISMPKQPVLVQEEVFHSENECIVCLSASKDAVLIPCGHICMCFDCSKQVQASSNACPICRSQIDHAFQVL